MNYQFTTTFFGFTKNEDTGEYLLVLQYFEKGDLRKQLQHQETITWTEKIEMIWWIARDMNEIHSAGMIHR